MKVQNAFIVMPVLVKGAGTDRRARAENLSVVSIVPRRVRTRTSMGERVTLTGRYYLTFGSAGTRKMKEKPPYVSSFLRQSPVKHPAG